MKFNNKLLGLVFVGLLVLYFGQKILNKPTVRSFKDVLVKVDTSLVNKIIFHPKGNSSRITMQKNGNGWTADNGEYQISATSNSVNSLLMPSTEIKTLQLISKNESKWAEYEVDDDAGKKVELYNGNQLLCAFYVGRFSFNQNTRSAKTYIRLADENDIYVVDGFLSMSYDKQFDDFRNKKLVNGLQLDDISQVRIEANDFNFSISKDINNHWIDTNEGEVDSLKAINAIRSVVNLRGNEILSGFNASQNEQIRLLLESNSGKPGEQISIYQNPAGGFAVKSSSNDDVFFKSDSTGIYKTAYLDFQNLR